MHVKKAIKKAGRRYMLEASVYRVPFKNSRLLAHKKQAPEAGDWRERALYYVREEMEFHVVIAQQSWSHQKGFMSMV